MQKIISFLITLYLIAGCGQNEESHQVIIDPASEEFHVPDSKPSRIPPPQADEFLK